MLPWKMGVANVPQKVRVQGVTTLAALAEVAHTWRSHFPESDVLNFNLDGHDRNI